MTAEPSQVAAPADAAPAHGAPTHGAPLNGAPLNGAPTRGAPTHGAPPTRGTREFPSLGGDLLVFAVALTARLMVVAWAGVRFPPAADGVYYHAIAVRLAEGLGATWLWPDGAVTYVAHYPVGYSALLAGAYRMFGTSVATAGTLNAFFGAASAVAVHRLVLAATTAAHPTGRWRSRGLAIAAGLATALHPGLVAYTPALMTEGVTASLLACAAWCASRRTRTGCVMLGVVLGVATLVRPQSLLLAPCWGALCVSPMARPLARLRRAAVASVLVLAVCAPWTARNCVRMKRCALVSVNGGWNLLIGAAPNGSGAWAPVEVPEACKTVWDEAAKDACFGREAQKLIMADPGRWLARIPARLAATFDYCGAAGFYLHSANPAAFGDDAKVKLGAVESVYERLTYLGALLAAALAAGPRRRARLAVAVIGTAALFTVHATIGVLTFVIVVALRGRELLRGPVLVPATWAAVLVTLAVHAVFFGAGRYGLVLFPLITACAFVRRATHEPPGAIAATRVF